MTSKQALKKQVYSRLQSQLESKSKTLQALCDSIEESRNSETKSSVGDKYETGRAMAQIELENTKTQLYNTLHVKKVLNSIDVDRNYTEAVLGAFVRSNRGVYFLSVGLGKIEIEKQVIYAVSLASPIGAALMGSKAGDTVLFQQTTLVIEEIW